MDPKPLLPLLLEELERLERGEKTSKSLIMPPKVGLMDWGVSGMEAGGESAVLPRE